MRGPVSKRLQDEQRANPTSMYTHSAWDRPWLTDMVTNVTGPAAMIPWLLVVSVAELRCAVL